MATRILAVVDRLQDTDGFAPGALLRFYETGTTTPISVFEDSDLAVEFAQPVECDEYGTPPPIYYSGTAPYRVLATDADGATLPGFPRDDMVGIPADLTGAGAIPFTPTESLPFTTVQAAIEGAAALSTDQTDEQDRALTPWTTGGTGDAYTVAPSPEVLGYGTFLSLRIKFDRANTGAATLNVNGLGARNIYKMQRSLTPTALASGDLQPGDILDLTYDGTQFVIAGPPPMGAVGGASGDYVRYPNGWQVCTVRATLAYDSADNFLYTWTFPAAFTSRAHVTVSLPASSSDYTGVTRTKLGQVTASAGLTLATIALWIVQGQSISSGASIANVGIRAEGRWY